jgi:hypothetical protein
MGADVALVKLGLDGFVKHAIRLPPAKELPLGYWPEALAMGGVTALVGAGMASNAKENPAVKLTRIHSNNQMQQRPDSVLRT